MLGSRFLRWLDPIYELHLQLYDRTIIIYISGYSCMRV